MDSMNHVYCNSATATVAAAAAAATVTSSPMTATTATVIESAASCASSTTTGGSPPLMLDEDALPELPPIDDDDDDEPQEEGEEDQDMEEDDDDMPDDEDPEEDPSDGDDFSADASLSAHNEVKQMQSILLLHLDLIQEQGDQILTKDKVIIKLKDENELLRHQLEQANKRLTMALLQLQQLGQPVPHELQQQLQQHQQQQQQQQQQHQQQQQQHHQPPQQHQAPPQKSPKPPKAEGTVSPLTIRSQMENGRLKAVVLKNSSTAGSSQSPPSSSSVSSTVLDTALQPAHSSSPLRNSEVSSTVSLIKEEPVEVLSPSMAEGEPSMAAYYADVEIKAENNEVDGEIFLNYSKSDDDDESASPPSSFGEDEREDEDPESVTDGDALVPVVEQGCYASNDGDSPMQYTSDDLSNEVCLPGGEDTESVFVPMIKMECTDEPQLLGGYDHEAERNAQDSSDIEQDEPLVESSAKVEEGPPADNKSSIRLVTMMAGDQNPTTTTAESERLTGHEQPKEESNEPNTASSSNNNSNHSNSNSIHYNPHCGSSGGNSSDGSLVKQQGPRCGKSGIATNTAAYMVTRKQYISCNWKDDAIASELERLLSNGAAELEIPSWSVIEESESSVPGSPSSDDVPLAEEIRSRENITDEAYLKRHTKLEIDERRRKKWDVQRIREQKHIERLKKRQLKELPAEQDAPKAIITFYPTVETLKHVVVTDDVPVQAFGELIPLLPATGFSLPWHQVKSNGGSGGPGGGPLPSSCSSSAPSLLSLSSCFANPSTSSLLPGLSSSDVHHRSEHRQHHPYLQPVPPPPPPPSSSSTSGPSIPHSGGFGSAASFESKTKFLHRLAPSLLAQKQRFTKRMKKEV